MSSKVYQSCLYMANGEIKCQYAQDVLGQKKLSIDHDDLINLRILRYDLMSNINFKPQKKTENY